ncbi:tail fiber protein [Enterobacter sp. Ap-1006]|uniref:tail fiber protein n=1 Tax=Enterobacter sp. Ap-1006 TaxID=2608345 RepID=UPI00141F7038|nr:tail fiber protein [Enterobacter sp. Ap-1006]
MNTLISSTTHSLPIGSVIAYGGDLSTSAKIDALNQLGWYLCDGKSLDTTQFADLFSAIGTSNGGGGNNFNLPDLRNRFLRGTSDSTQGVDPDAANRVAAATGGATGNNTGSLEKTATALPANQWVLQHAGLHTHTCQHLTSDMHMAWDGSTYSMARWSGNATLQNAGAHSHTVSGFDNATQPINIALYYIIKVSESSSTSGIIPAGAVVGFAGTLNTLPTGWLKCNGAAYSINTYGNLMSTIFYNYGGDGVAVFNVPDFRGYFLRGTSHVTGRDPDAVNRHALNTGGNTGDAIGSAQYYATGASIKGIVIDNAGAHAHNITLIPNQYHNAAYGASGPLAYNCMEWTDAYTTSSQSGDHNHSLIGGDKETRPENIYANFLIANDNIELAAPPVGSIMSFGGDITDPGVTAQLMADGWLPCDGSALRIASFQALYSVIGSQFGEAPLKFKVPDLRGYFVIGAGSIAVGTTTNVSLTGAPVTPFITSTDGDHNHTMYNVPTDTHTIDVVMGVELAQNNTTASPTSTDGIHTHTISGGDKESRPTNVNVDYIIRFQ